MSQVDHAEGISVTRLGTQVVVRLSGVIDDSRAARLDKVLIEVDELVLHAVVVDCSDAAAISGAGLAFLREARLRWRLRLLGPPPGLRSALEQAS